MRRRGAISEKFFCCKNFDSESVRHAAERTFECFGVLIVQLRHYRELKAAAATANGGGH